MVWLLPALFLRCFSTYGHTMADEAYAQRYGTGSGVTGGGVNVSPLVNALFLQIDNARLEREKKGRCTELFRHLSNGDAPAYEWQGYYSRCRSMDVY